MPPTIKYTWGQLGDAIAAMSDEQKAFGVVIGIAGAVDLVPGAEEVQLEVCGSNTDSDGNAQLFIHKNA